MGVCNDLMSEWMARRASVAAGKCGRELGGAVRGRCCNRGGIGQQHVQSSPAWRRAHRQHVLSTPNICDGQCWAPWPSSAWCGAAQEPRPHRAATVLLFCCCHCLPQTTGTICMFPATHKPGTP